MAPACSAHPRSASPFLRAPLSPHPLLSRLPTGFPGGRSPRISSSRGPPSASAALRGRGPAPPASSPSPVPASDASSPPPLPSLAVLADPPGAGAPSPVSHAPVSSRPSRRRRPTARRAASHTDPTGRLWRSCALLYRDCHLDPFQGIVVAVLLSLQDGVHGLHAADDFAEHRILPR